MSTKKMLSRSQVKARGWTLAAIDEWLGEHEATSGTATRLYSARKVTVQEGRVRFQEFFKGRAYSVRSKATAKKASQ